MKNIWILSMLTAFFMLGCTENTKTVEDTKDAVIDTKKEKDKGDP